MKKLLIFAATGMLLFSGCRDIVKVNGKPCEMLFESEEKELQAIALATLQHNLGKKNVVEPEEYRMAVATQPQCEIHYYADLIGRAEYTWEFPTRKTTVVIQGEFLNPKQRIVFLSIQPKQPDVIDTTRKIPKNAPIYQKKK